MFMFVFQYAEYFSNGFQCEGFHVSIPDHAYQSPPVTCFTGHVPLIADGGIVVEFERGEGPVAPVGERLA